MDYIEVEGRKIALITSKDNELVKRFSKLSSAKYRELEGLFLAEGVKLSEEALDAGWAEHILVCSGKTGKEVSRLAAKADGRCRVTALSESAFSKITTESAPQGIIAVCRIPGRTDFSFEGKKVLALDGIRDPGNLGTIIRSALAFGYDALLSGDGADVFSPKTVRASMGAVFALPVIECDDLAQSLSKLKEQGRRVIGAVLRDDSLEFGKYPLDKGDIIVIGNEGHGISEEVLGQCSSYTKIPIGERSESLNAAIAASVVMWEYSKL